MLRKQTPATFPVVLLFGFLLASVPAVADNDSDSEKIQKFHDDRRNTKISYCQNPCQAGLGGPATQAEFDTGPAPVLPPAPELDHEYINCVGTLLLDGFEIEEAEEICDG